MGNRATVIFTDGKDSFSPAVYLHWNGGPESIYAFLDEMDRREIRADQDYECARFIHIVGEFFDMNTITGLSLGVANGPKSADPKDLEEIQTDHGDNGFYLVNRTGGKPKVRRFVAHWNWDDKNGGTETIVEMSEIEVVRERKGAEKHEYKTGIREAYLKMTSGKKLECFG